MSETDDKPPADGAQEAAGGDQDARGRFTRGNRANPVYKAPKSKGKGQSWAMKRLRHEAEKARGDTARIQALKTLVELERGEPGAQMDHVCPTCVVILPPVIGCARCEDGCTHCEGDALAYLAYFSDAQLQRELERRGLAQGASSVKPGPDTTNPAIVEPDATGEAASPAELPHVVVDEFGIRWPKEEEPNDG
jgi:hypothetical protein